MGWIRHAWVTSLMSWAHSIPRRSSAPEKIGRDEEEIMLERASFKKQRKDMEEERIKKKQEKCRRKKIRTAMNKRFKRERR